MRDVENSTFQAHGQLSVMRPERLTRLRSAYLADGQKWAPHAVLDCRDGTRQYASGCLFDLYLVGLCVSRWMDAGWHDVDVLSCACKGIWVPRHVGVRGVLSVSTV
jgi:hypothetical protein